MGKDQDDNYIELRKKLDETPDSFAEYMMDMEWCALSIFNFLDAKTLGKCERVCDMWNTHIYNNSNKLYKKYYLENCAKRKITKNSIHVQLDNKMYNLTLHWSAYSPNGIWCYNHNNSNSTCNNISHYDRSTTEIIIPKRKIKDYKTEIVKHYYLTCYSPSLNSNFNKYFTSFKNDKNILNSIEDSIIEIFNERKNRSEFRKELNFYNKNEILTEKSRNRITSILKDFKEEKKQMSIEFPKKNTSAQIIRIKNLLDRFL
jgi:hypothetical protein